MIKVFCGRDFFKGFKVPKVFKDLKVRENSLPFRLNFEEGVTLRCDALFFFIMFFSFEDSDGVGWGGSLRDLLVYLEGL